MSIHSEHPFLPPAADRDPIRRFRGRMIAPVSLWATGSGRRRLGWTVSSLLVADGPEPTLLGLLDPDADLTEALVAGPVGGSSTTGSGPDPAGSQPSSRGGPIGASRVAVSLLGWQHRHLPDAFAGLAPAPGGPFRLAEWIDTAYGPVLARAPATLGATLVDTRPVGWSTLVLARIEEIQIGPEAEADSELLGHLRGRYLPVGNRT